MTKTEIVHQFYISLAKGDFEKVGSLLADDLVWHQPGKKYANERYRSLSGRERQNTRGLVIL